MSRCFAVLTGVWAANSLLPISPRMFIMHRLTPCSHHPTRLAQAGLPSCPRASVQAALLGLGSWPHDEVGEGADARLCSLASWCTLAGCPERPILASCSTGAGWALGGNQASQTRLGRPFWASLLSGP